MGKSPLPRSVVLLAFLMAAAAEGATFTVTNTKDNLVGSLRQAIQDAAPGDTIVFDIPTTDPRYRRNTAVYDIGLTSGELVISKNLTIDGAGAKIEVRRSGTATFGIFNVVSGNVTIANLTISNGAGVNGSGVKNTGNLTLRNCTIIGNGAGSTLPPRGGGINNEGTAEVTNCTIFDNNAQRGAGIYNAGNIFVRNSTIFRNGQGAAGDTPGFEQAAGVARVRSSVIALNSKSLSGDAANVLGAFTSEGYNFISNADGSTGFGNSGSRDQVGTRAAPANPQLPNATGDYGGPTEVLRPLSISPLIDQGDSGGIGSDQRGVARPIDQPTIANAGDGADIGAVETGLTQSGPAFTVTTTADRRDFGDSPCTTDDCTLAEALDRTNANSDANTINFSLGLTGTIGAPAPSFEISAPVTINGPGARKLTLSGQGFRRVLITAARPIVISGVTISSGATASSSVTFKGGAAIVNTGEVTLTNCAIEDNTSPTTGGAIFSATGSSLSLDGCTFARNRSLEADGGAICSFGSVTAVNSTFSDNAASNGGAISIQGDGTLSLLNCTIVRCSGSDVGGVGTIGKSAVVANSIIAGNTGSADVRGTFTSAGHNLIGQRGSSTGFTDGVNNDQVGTAAAPRDPQVGFLQYNGGPTGTCALLTGSPAIDAGNDNSAPRVDQRGYSRIGVSDIGAFELGGLPTGFANISTRLQVGRDDNVLIGGFIITGSQPKKLMVRAIGPSTGIASALADPQLEIFNSGGELVAFNDNWQDAPNRTEMQDSTIAPTNNAESAVLRTVNPGAYTAVVSGVGGGTGVGLVEVYDLDRAADSKLANIATRGFVRTGDDVMIGGFIIVGGGEQRLLVRAIGPSLSIAGKLADPLLEVYNGEGALLASNDNWRSTQEAEIAATGIPPSNTFEAAIIGAAPAGAYTAIVRGAGDTTGIAVVEVYALD